VIGFSEEEGVRFGVPFLGSLALVGRVDCHLVSEAVQAFGLDPARIGEAQLSPFAFAFLEFHIEQGPVLEQKNEPLAVVEAITGQSRYGVKFTGSANHAGTTPMRLRRDALAGAAEWITAIEGDAKQTDGLVATVGAIHSEPRAGNVIPGEVSATLDVRHASDETRRFSVERILGMGAAIADQRGLKFHAQMRLDQAAVRMDADLVAIAQKTCHAPLITSGAGHDAMIMAEKVPSVMIFLRSPGGISHHPDESVLPGDIDLALEAGLRLLKELARQVS
jgi:allantoate deiminase